MDKQESLEEYLALEELEDALTFISGRTSSGEHGLTKEFYQTFFPLDWKRILSLYIDSFLKGSLSISPKRRIALIPKGYVNLTDLNNWLDISSLNIGYRLLSKVLAKTMEQR